MNPIGTQAGAPTVATQTSHVPQIRQMARDGKARFLLQFGGQGNAFLPELTRLYAEYGAEFAPFFEMCFAVVADVQARADVRADPGLYFPHGFALRDWLRDKDVPPSDALFECPLSFPGTTMLQLAQLYAIARGGYPLEELGHPTIAATGHSQGILAANVFALAAGTTPDAFLQICYDWLLWFCVSGLYIKRGYRPPRVPDADLEFSLATDGGGPTPMAVVFGARTTRIAEWIEAYAASDREMEAYSPAVARQPIHIALINSPTVHVLAGHPVDLCRFRRRYLEQFVADEYDWEYLAVSAPYHSGPHLREISRAFARDVAYTSLRYHSRDLRVPLVSFVDGKDMHSGSSLVDELTEILFHGRLDWYRTMRSIHENYVAPTHVLDFGPGRTSATLSRKFYESLVPPPAVQMLALNRASGLRSFLD